MPNMIHAFPLTKEAQDLHESLEDMVTDAEQNGASHEVKDEINFLRRELIRVSEMDCESTDDHPFDKLFERSVHVINPPARKETRPFSKGGGKSVPLETGGSVVIFR